MSQEYLADILLEANNRGCMDLAYRLCAYFSAANARTLQEMSTDAAAGYGCATRRDDGNAARDG